MTTQEITSHLRAEAKRLNAVADAIEGVGSAPGVTSAISATGAEPAKRRGRPAKTAATNGTTAVVPGAVAKKRGRPSKKDQLAAAAAAEAQEAQPTNIGEEATATD